MSQPAPPGINIRNVMSHLSIRKRRVPNSGRGDPPSLRFVVLLLSTAITLTSCSTPQSSSKSVGTPESHRTSQATGLTPVSRILQEAAHLRNQGKFREAEILLTRAQQTDGENLVVWQAMLSLQLQVTGQAIQEQPGLPQPRGKALVEGGKELERARSTLNGIRGLSVVPGSLIDPKAVVEAEATFTGTEDRFKEEAQSYCKSRLEYARVWRRKAHHWPTKNDRANVVDGLEDVRRVQALMPWVGDDIHGSAATVMSELKALVNEEEWPDLLARAGFDPNSSPH